MTDRKQLCMMDWTLPKKADKSDTKIMDKETNKYIITDVSTPINLSHNIQNKALRCVNMQCQDMVNNLSLTYYHQQ